LFLPLGFLGEIYRQLRQMITDMEKMFALLDQKPQVADAPNAPGLSPGGGAVRFDNVTLALGGRPILRGLSFAVPAGARYAIVGRTGAGKTTIVRLLTRMLDPDGGKIFIDDCNVAEVAQKSLRAAVAVVSQDAAMFHDTLRYNINYGDRDADIKAVAAAADTAMLGDFISKLPKGLDTVVGERGLKLSGGERQRVAIARALLKSPRLMIFDEATSSLDSATEERIRAAIAKASQGRTALIIAHRLATVTDADNIMVLDKGKVAESGTHRELLANGGFYAEMWRLQAEDAPAAA
jgi:ATP-binding cassette subfamily B protein